MLYLKKANLEDADAEYEALQKIPTNENGFENKYFDMTKQEFTAKYLPKIIANSKGEDLPEGYVPFSIFFLWNDDDIVGVFHFRHHLCESLKKCGGHIGYAIISKYRGKGYATKGLSLLLDEIGNQVPEDEIWLDAHKDNIASQKVMLNNGAYKVGEVEHDGITHIQMRIRKHN